MQTKLVSNRLLDRIPVLPSRMPCEAVGAQAFLEVAGVHKDKDEEVFRNLVA